MDRRQALSLVVPTTTARSFLPYVLTAAGIFCSAAFLGAAAGVGAGSSPIFPVRESAPALGTYTFWDFFAHNAPFGLILAVGWLLAGLPTLYLLVFNGFTIGSVLAGATADFGVVVTLVGVLPHGVFELPALWLGAAVSFRVLHAVWKATRSEGLSHPPHVFGAQTVLAVVAMLALFAVAALVEARVTPALLGLVL